MGPSSFCRRKLTLLLHLIGHPRLWSLLFSVVSVLRSSGSVLMTIVNV